MASPKRSCAYPFGFSNTTIVPEPQKGSRTWVGDNFWRSPLPSRELLFAPELLIRLMSLENGSDCRSDCGSDCRDLLEWEQQNNYLVNCFRSKRNIFWEKVEGLKHSIDIMSVDEQRAVF